MTMEILSGLHETIRDFADRWFGELSNIIVGTLQPNTRYIVSDYPLSGIADIIIEYRGTRFYLYEVFVASDYYTEEVDVELI